MSRKETGGAAPSSSNVLTSDVQALSKKLYEKLGVDASVKEIVFGKIYDALLKQDHIFLKELTRNSYSDIFDCIRFMSCTAYLSAQNNILQLLVHKNMSALKEAIHALLYRENTNKDIAIPSSLLHEMLRCLITQKRIIDALIICDNPQYFLRILLIITEGFCDFARLRGVQNLKQHQQQFLLAKADQYRENIIGQRYEKLSEFDKTLIQELFHPSASASSTAGIFSTTPHAATPTATSSTATTTTPLPGEKLEPPDQDPCTQPAPWHK